HTRFSRDWSSDVCSSDLPTFEPKLIPEQVEADAYIPCMILLQATCPSPDLNRIPFRDETTFCNPLTSSHSIVTGTVLLALLTIRSEERRVGKACRYVVSE